MSIKFQHFVMLLIMVAFCGWWFGTSTTNSAQLVEAEKLRYLQAQNEIALHEYEKRAEATTQFYTTVATVVVPYTLVCIVGGVVVVGLWAAARKRSDSDRRAKEGSFALQVFRQNGQIVVVDPNKMLGPTILLEPKTTPESLPQLEVAKAVQTTRTAAALTSSDGGGFRYAATGKFLAGMYNRPSNDSRWYGDGDQAPQLEAPPTALLPDAIAAFEQSTKTQWVLGQNRESGEPYTLCPQEVVHFGIVGATGAGKTAYVALLVVANALRSGWRVVVLDGKGGADWSRLAEFVEYHTLDYTNVAEFVLQIKAEYERRQAKIKAAGIHSVWALNEQGKTMPRPTLFVIDEFGATMDALRVASLGEYKKLVVELGNLLRLSRATGLHLVFCDQDPSKWPGTMRANLPVNIVFRLGGQKGNGISEYSLNELERTGHFQVNGERYHAWPTYQVINQLLGRIKVCKPKALLSALPPQREALSERSEATGVYRVLDTSSTQEGMSDALSVSQHTPLCTVHDDTPEVGSDTHRRCSDTQEVGSDTHTRLVGKPATDAERQLVLDAYNASGGNIKTTCEQVWGGRTPSRIGWVKEIVGVE
ncbi:MAG: FtsK/SpoIIIE domain-containing protein [Caldilineaceae bacterium]